MPNFFPEGNIILPSDDPARTAAKYCQLLFNANGEKPSPFPEGCAPKPGDDYQRLLQKINALEQ